MTNALDNMWRVLAEFVPKLVAFLLILVIGYIVAKVIAKAIDKVLTRVGFDRAVERGGLKKALQGSQSEPSGIVSKIVYYGLMLFVLQMAFGVFGPNPISELLTGVIAFLPKVLVAILIIVIAAAIAAAVKGLIQNTLGGLSYGKALANVASIFILGLGVIAALNQVDIATTVTTPILIAVLATLAGVLIVGVGGGLIQPMSQRWERYLMSAEQEAPRIRAEAAAAPSVGEQARQAKDQLQSQTSEPAPDETGGATRAR